MAMTLNLLRPAGPMLLLGGIKMRFLCVLILVSVIGVASAALAETPSPESAFPGRRRQRGRFIPTN